MKLFNFFPYFCCRHLNELARLGARPDQGDLAKVCAASRVGAQIESHLLPRSAAMRGAVDPETARRYVLAGGDDYELVFTLPPGADAVPLERGGGVALARIGTIVAGPGIALDGEPLERDAVHGFDHFG